MSLSIKQAENILRAYDWIEQIQLTEADPLGNVTLRLKMTNSPTWADIPFYYSRGYLSPRAVRCNKTPEQYLVDTLKDFDKRYLETVKRGLGA